MIIVVLVLRPVSNNQPLKTNKNGVGPNRCFAYLMAAGMRIVIFTLRKAVSTFRVIPPLIEHHDMLNGCKPDDG